MNDLLKDTLTERADGAEPPALDLDGIVSAGDRRIGRRRVTAILGGAVVTAAGITGGLSIARRVDDRPAPATPLPFTERRATYAIGGEIHFGPDIISVAPHKVGAFVQTDAGFVFLTEDQNEIYVADRSGVRPLGKSAWRLTAGNHGNLVAWVEDGTKESQSVVYDVAAGREVVRTALGNKRGPMLDLVMGPRIPAIDGDAVYLGAINGLYRWDTSTGKNTFIAAEGLPNAVRGVSSGQYLYVDPAQHPQKVTRLLLGPSPKDTAGRAFPGRQGYLSPSGGYVVAGPADNMYGEPGAAALDLYAAKTGARLALRHPDHPRLIFSQWLNDTTFTAVGLRPGKNSPVDLLTCSATALTCEVSAEAFSTYTFDKTPPITTPFAVPLGTPIIQYFN
ncbi:hypothetical protein AB0L70_06640 [Kribbella sp. NPDC051952]|uniref:hypothetical protein n=1 Tax=Kribbella sp. NPDC051952 TaxID=3154851 RepID=UPI0034355A90